MVPSEAQYEDPAAWLARADGALETARQAGIPNTFWEDYCFYCQQAAERAIKAVYIFCRLSFRYTHNIEQLITSLEGDVAEISNEVKAAAFLTRYASETRYPGTYEPITEAEYRRALAAAEAVVKWAHRLVQT